MELEEAERLKEEEEAEESAKTQPKFYELRAGEEFKSIRALKRKINK